MLLPPQTLDACLGDVPGTSLLHLPAVRADVRCRCGVCDILIPAGSWYGDHETLGAVCSSSCLRDAEDFSCQLHADDCGCGRCMMDVDEQIDQLFVTLNDLKRKAKIEVASKRRDIERQIATCLCDLNRLGFQTSRKFYPVPTTAVVLDTLRLPFLHD